MSFGACASKRSIVNDTIGRFSHAGSSGSQLSQDHVAGHQGVKATRCCVACFAGNDAMAEFYSGNAHAIAACSLPVTTRKKLPRYDTVPAIYLSVIGVDSKHQGLGLGLGAS